MTAHLFVYGSLMTSAFHPSGERLRRESILLGPASVDGRLHRVSWYPGLAPAAGPEDRVHGELYALSEPAATLPWLDEYEGIASADTGVASSDEYFRAVRPALHPDGVVREAWVYLYRRPLDPSSLIPDGRWRG